MAPDRTTSAATQAHGPTASGRPQDLGGYLAGAALRSGLARCPSRVRLTDYLSETPQGMGGIGVWQTLWQVILSALEAEQKLDWAQAFLEGSFVPAKKGALEWA